MANNKYIGTKDAVRLTGLSVSEIYDLIHSGKLPAHKAPKSGWRISTQDIAELGLLQEENEPILEEPQVDSCLSFVSDEEHYTQIFRRMTEVKHSLKIATANLKTFSVNIEHEDQQEKLRIYDFFLSLVERGVHVQIVCMKPFNFYQVAKKECPQLLENPLFELRYNGHNHMKIFIFDDEYAYIGSANITSAAIGKRARRKRNYEAGILVWGPTLIQAPSRQFEKVWNDPEILKSSSKRFATEAKDKAKKYKRSED